MKEQLLEAWRISHKMTILFINSIDDQGMEATLSKHGGRRVYLQFVHVHNVRLGWLEHAAKDIFLRNKLLEKDALYNKKKLCRALDESAAAIEEFINMSWDEGGKMKGFKSGLIPFIAYLVAHEGHHRGHAILTVKQSGFKIPDQVKWGLWEWDK